MFHVALVFGSVILIFLIMFLIYIVIKSIITYVFESIFLYNVSKKEKYKYLFISFIPIINKYYLGKITNRKTVAIVDIVALVLILAWWIIFVISFITGETVPWANQYNIGWLWLLLMLINFIICIYLSHIVMKKIVGDKAIAFTLLNVFTLGISRPIVLFAMRKRY